VNSPTRKCDRFFTHSEQLDAMIAALWSANGKRLRAMLGWRAVRRPASRTGPRGFSSASPEGASNSFLSRVLVQNRDSEVRPSLPNGGSCIVDELSSIAPMQGQRLCWVSGGFTILDGTVAVYSCEARRKAHWSKLSWSAR
jgi:hypothetical protein